MSNQNIASTHESKRQEPRGGIVLVLGGALAAVVAGFIIKERAREELPHQGQAPVEISIKYSWVTIESRSDERRYGIGIPYTLGKTSSDAQSYRGAHAYVVAHDPNSGRSFVTRAGPERACENPGFRLGSPASVRSVSDSEIAVRGCPHFCRDTVSGLEKLWAFAYEGTDECNGRPLFIQKVARIHENFSHVVSEMKRLAKRNNQCNENRYRAFNVINETNNSNTYAFEVVARLTGNRPIPNIPAPGLRAPGVRLEAAHGWRNVVGDNGVSCLGADRVSLSDILSACLSTARWLLNPIGPSYNYCRTAPNRWVGGAGVRSGTRIDLVDVLRQTSVHFRVSGSSRLEALARNIETCLRTYWDRPFYKDDFCTVSVSNGDDAALWHLGVGEHLVTARKVIGVAKRAATEFAG